MDDNNLIVVVRSGSIVVVRGGSIVVVHGGSIVVVRGGSIVVVPTTNHHEPLRTTTNHHKVSFKMRFDTESWTLIG